MSAAGFPKWVMLEPFVFRRDDDESFPDDTKAPIRASGTTSWGARFRIAFTLAEPPHISRLYAQLPVPGFLAPGVSTPLAILGTHHHLVLFRLATKMSTTLQDFFIYSAKDNPPSLKALLPCTEPAFDYSRADGRRSRHRRPCDSSHPPPRLLAVRSMGLWCHHSEFVVAELNLFAPINRSKVFADICFLRGNDQLVDGTGNDQLVDGTWNSIRVDIQCSNKADDLWQLNRWNTNTVIPFHQWLCWIDYNQGILLCDMSKLPTPTISFLPRPELPSGNCFTELLSGNCFSDVPSGNCFTKIPSGDCFIGNYSFLYCGASLVNRALKFVSVTRHDGLAFGALKPGTGFTITCHTLMFGPCNMKWEEDYTVTSSQLWEANPAARLPRGMLMFPQVDMYRPHAVHFLFIEFGFVSKNMWVVSVDMSTKIVLSFSPYVNGKEDLKTDNADLVRAKSMGPLPFLPCEFPRFLCLSRKRKQCTESPSLQ